MLKIKTLINHFFSVKQLLYGLVSLFFILSIVFPIIYTLITTIFTENLLNNISTAFNRNTYFLLIKSIAIAFAIAFLSTILGTILGFILNKTNIVFAKFFKIVLLIPLFISPYILSVAWKDLIYLFSGNLTFISSYIGTILVLTIVYTPLSILIIGSSLSNINVQLEESGFIITKFHKVIFKIILPLIKPALITSFVLVFIFSISEFSVPAFFGLKVLTTEIFIQFSAFYNHSIAILQSILLVFICILLLFFEKKHIKDATFLSIGSKGTKTKIYNLKSGKTISILFLFAWFFISIVLPFIILILQSFSKGTSKFIQAFELLKPTFIDSISLAFWGSIIIIFISYIAANISIKHNKNKIQSTFDWFLLVVFAIPSIIFGISLIKFYNQPALNFIYSSSIIIIIGYVGKFSFIATKIIANALKQIPKSLIEAAKIQGVSFLKQQQKIIIPIIIPSIFVAFIISFIFSFAELGITIMLYPPGTEIMSIKVFTIMANATQSLTSSMTLIVFSITLLITTFFYMLFVFIQKKVR